ncbi:hypothetical protein TNCV_42491 [Trichonephila clavipes]|nr:hypothetical protein TNCV_42491 [Trichonephila clavipes]
MYLLLFDLRTSDVPLGSHFENENNFESKKNQFDLNPSVGHGSEGVIVTNTWSTLSSHGSIRAVQDFPQRVPQRDHSHFQKLGCDGWAFQDVIGRELKIWEVFALDLVLSSCP